MVLLDGAIIATSLPAMATSFGVAAVDLSVAISVYILAVAAMVPLAGWTSDRFGARTTFLCAIVVFTVASLACGAAQDLPEFIAARALQGVGGAFMTPVGRMLVLRNTRKSELLQATALITWPALMAPVIGPAVGGFVTTYFSWRWNFYINAPLGLLAFILAWSLIPRHPPEQRRAFDFPGFLLTAGALLGLLYGLESFAHQHFSKTGSCLLFATGALLACLAVRHLKRSPQPLLNLDSFRCHTFAMSTLWAGTYVRTGINATPFLLPLLFQLGFGMTPLEAGGYILVYFLGNLGMKTITTLVLRCFGFRRVLLVNGVLCGAAIAACGFFTQDTARVVMMVVLFFAGLTRSMQYTALNTLAFADIPDHWRSSAATLSSMLQQVSMVLGIAMGVILLRGSQYLAERQELALIDFHVAFIGMGILVVIASCVFLRLSPDAGAEVTGHQGGSSTSQ